MDQARDPRVSTEPRAVHVGRWSGPVSVGLYVASLTPLCGPACATAGTWVAAAGTYANLADAVGDCYSGEWGECAQALLGAATSGGSSFIYNQDPNHLAAVLVYADMQAFGLTVEGLLEILLGDPGEPWSPPQEEIDKVQEFIEGTAN